MMLQIPQALWLDVQVVILFYSLKAYITDLYLIPALTCPVQRSHISARSSHVWEYKPHTASEMGQN